MSSIETIQDNLAAMLATSRQGGGARVSTAVVTGFSNGSAQALMAGDVSTNTPVLVCADVEAAEGDTVLCVSSGAGGRWYAVANMSRAPERDTPSAQGPDSCPLMGGTATAWRVGDLCSVSFNAQVTYDVDPYADVIPEALRSWLTNQARTPAGIDMLVPVYNGWFLSYGTVDGVRTWRLWNIERAVSAGEYIVGTVCFANVPA